MSRDTRESHSPSFTVLLSLALIVVVEVLAFQKAMENAHAPIFPDKSYSGIFNDLPSNPE